MEAGDPDGGGLKEMDEKLKRYADALPVNGGSSVLQCLHDSDLYHRHGLRFM